MKRILIIILLLVAVSNSGRCQYSSTNKKAIKHYETAVNLYASDPAGALKLVDMALEYDPNFAEALMTAADMYRQQGMSEKAKGYYQRFLNSGSRHKSWIAEARHSLECIDFEEQAKSHPVPFAPKNLGPNVNSQFEEYFPSLTVDGKNLVYTRRFPRTAKTTANTPEEEDFYMSTLGDDGEWQRSVRMSEPVNSTNNEGAQCISQDGRIMFFTACERQDGVGSCDIYMCVRRGDKWNKPRCLGNPVNTGGWESQPSFSIDGKTLYFVSNRAGGYGGYDIWMTTFEDGRFTSPQNMGPNINTEDDEQTPFIHYDDNTLYFASKGHVGMGGYDLYVSRRQPDGTWGKAENLGYPINTEGDEVGLMLSYDGTTAYMASNRLGGYGGLDLFSFQLPQEARSAAVCFMKGLVTDAQTGKPVAADVQILDLKDGHMVANTSSDAITGEYMVALPMSKDYAINVSAKDYLFYSENVELRIDAKQHWRYEDLEFVQNVSLNHIQKGENIRLNNVFFESGHYVLLPESRVELDKVVELLVKNPTIKVEVGGHTDNVGSDTDNQVLSENRAKSVYDYLIGKGISKDRLSYKGYGESKPVADNATEEGRRMNRRTELTVL